MGEVNSVVETAVERTSWGSPEMNCCVASTIVEDFTAFLEMHPLKHESSLMKKIT
jgi:hypothetical protein